MKAKITKVANGYTMEMDGRTFVGTSTNDIMKVIVMRAGDTIWNAIADHEGDECEIEITIAGKDEKDD